MRLAVFIESPPLLFYSFSGAGYSGKLQATMSTSFT